MKEIMVKNKMTIDVTVSMYRWLKNHQTKAILWLIVLLILLIISIYTKEWFAFCLSIVWIMFWWFLGMYAVSKHANDFLNAKARNEG